MHIHPAILESYAAGELSQPQLASVDAHVSNCLFCAHAIADQTVELYRSLIEARR